MLTGALAAACLTSSYLCRSAVAVGEDRALLAAGWVVYAVSSARSAIVGRVVFAWAGIALGTLPLIAALTSTTIAGGINNVCIATAISCGATRNAGRIADVPWRAREAATGTIEVWRAGGTLGTGPRRLTLALAPTVGQHANLIRSTRLLWLT